ncbi:hypothetical protein TEA_015251 [Camellia sinensis var. sinensis]|uniref:ABC transmembrane type-1 domain-containing protein n=1 Tax=Camellia sinensis var. sinensis TaxID=542762 RepID=A0A4S4D0B6_CAMSN|nr:hypothetical protein TEA_015251 [Camellia sinensis var. sinensis]
MTNYYIDRYLKNWTFYKIQSQSIIDNPDQRIVDDLSSFTGTALSFSLTLFNAAVDLVSFSNILYGIYPPLFAVLLVYSIGGTAISVFLGRGLVTLNFLQEKKEADFRFGLVRLRENAESIAFYAGEDNEKQLLLQRFRSAFENLTARLCYAGSGWACLVHMLQIGLGSGCDSTPNHAYSVSIVAAVALVVLCIVAALCLALCGSIVAAAASCWFFVRYGNKLLQQ